MPFCSVTFERKAERDFFSFDRKQSCWRALEPGNFSWKNHVKNSNERRRLVATYGRRVIRLGTGNRKRAYGRHLNLAPTLGLAMSHLNLRYYTERCGMAKRTCYHLNDCPFGIDEGSSSVASVIGDARGWLDKVYRVISMTLLTRPIVMILFLAILLDLRLTNHTADLRIVVPYYKTTSIFAEVS